MLRSVEPEWLDTLEASDPRARRSRRDLRLINFIMGNAGSVALALGNVLANGARIADLGAGDGTVMLRVARRIRARPIRVELMLVDRAGAISAATIARFRELQWNAMPRAADAIEWLQQAPAGFDVITANLFLHHFEPRALRQLLLLVSARTRVFVACEPRRSRFALAASRVLGVAGCGPETRHDAAVSVRAGFRGYELSQAWPAMQDWELKEGPAGLFNHLFIARQREAP
jgi:2-polyprenyl-3-methyl-5-hydroxy-6-metoxy-1,4-benzoquinol methylase